MSTSGLDVTDEPRGHVQAVSSIRWEDQRRASWDLCRPCFDLALERLRDVAGAPHDEWVRDEADTRPDAMAKAVR